MTDTTHTLLLSDADFNDLSDLLRRFGLNQIGRENFWREMTARGWTQDTIDAWCAEYHETGQDRRPQTRAARHGA